MQELMQALPIHGRNPDEKGYILATNCFCFYTEDKGPVANPPGGLWRLIPQMRSPPAWKSARVKMPN